jgi:hypothetical protein
MARCGFGLASGAALSSLSVHQMARYPSSGERLGGSFDRAKSCLPATSVEPCRRYDFGTALRMRAL